MIMFYHRRALGFVHPSHINLKISSEHGVHTKKYVFFSNPGPHITFFTSVGKKGLRIIDTMRPQVSLDHPVMRRISVHLVYLKLPLVAYSKVVKEIKS